MYHLYRYSTKCFVMEKQKKSEYYMYFVQGKGPFGSYLSVNQEGAISVVGQRRVLWSRVHTCWMHSTPLRQENCLCSFSFFFIGSGYGSELFSDHYHFEVCKLNWGVCVCLLLCMCVCVCEKMVEKQLLMSQTTLLEHIPALKLFRDSAKKSCV